jgi:hypothetical protein
VQVILYVEGELPTPCHELAVEVMPPDEQNQIHIQMYSEVEAGAICAQVMEPFEANVSIPMAGAPDGVYTVVLNGEVVGEFSYPG